MQFESLKNIRYLKHAATRTDANPGNARARKAIVLLHGYGADASDLYPLGRFLPDDCDVFFPEGILEVAFTPWYSGRAWFSIDMQGLQDAMQRRDYVKFAFHQPPGLNEAADQVKMFYEALAQDYPDGVILGGFSQGAMVACQVALSANPPPRGLVLLSVNPTNLNAWKEAMQARALPVFMSHGLHDEILAADGAKILAKAFEEYRWPLEFHEFAGGHEIPQTVLTKALGFVRRNLP